MTVRDLKERLELSLVAGEEGLDRTVTGGYCGDLLSWVMGRMGTGDAWITIMGNINVLAVAALADPACILLAEGAAMDTEAREKADAEGIPVLSSPRPAFELAGFLFCLLS